MKYFDGHSSTGNVLPNSATLITSAEETVISKDGNSEETVDEEVVKMTDIEPNVAVSTELQWLYKWGIIECGAYYVHMIDVTDMNGRVVVLHCCTQAESQWNVPQYMQHSVLSYI